MIIYVLAAVMPAILMMRHVCRQDRIEREPAYLLGNLAWKGVLVALAATILEVIATGILVVLVAPANPIYTVLLAFLCVAAVKEGTKLFFLYRRTWNDFNFNFRYDAIIYAVFVSLGFAAFENLKYVFNYGLFVALPRTILAIPGHMGFAVYMGYFHGCAKLCGNDGNSAGRKINLTLDYAAAVLLHGIYDACCMMGTTRSSLFFVLFVIALYIAVFSMIRHESRTDEPD